MSKSYNGIERCLGERHRMGHNELEVFGDEAIGLITAVLQYRSTLQSLLPEYLTSGNGYTLADALTNVSKRFDNNIMGLPTALPSQKIVRPEQLNTLEKWLFANRYLHAVKRDGDVLVSMQAYKNDHEPIIGMRAKTFAEAYRSLRKIEISEKILSELPSPIPASVGWPDYWD